MRSDKISSNGFFGRKCENWFERKLGCYKALLTPSCTAALEMAAILINVKNGDEIEINSITKKLNLKITNAEFKKRMKSWKQPKLKRSSGVLSKYAKLVSQADEGAITVD